MKYRPPSYYNLAEASAELHRFFRDTVEARVCELLKRTNNMALLAHMFPIGDDIPETLRRTFLRAKPLQPLAIQSRNFVESRLSSNHSMIEEG